jgi:transcription antitermination factor NusG
MRENAHRSLINRGAEQAAGWYAIHTRSRHEKKVALELERSHVETFLPVALEMHRWSDRQKRIAVPLFSCYIFAHFAPGSSERLTVQRAAGVNAIVGYNGGTPIPDQEINSIRAMLASEVPFMRCRVRKGERVRLRGGALDGVEGTLLSEAGERRLVISVGDIDQSISISVEGYELEAA